MAEDETLGGILGPRPKMATAEGYKPTRVPAVPARAQTFRNETALVKSLIDWLRLQPECWARKVHGSRYQDAGEPDIDGCLRGRAIKIEVKMPGNRPTGVQMGALRRWAKAGALAGWVTSKAQLEELLSHADDRAWQNPQLDREAPSD